MAAWRRAIELSLGDVAVERLRPGTPTSVFLAERLELPAAAGTDVALAARKLRLRGQLRSGFGLWRRDGQRRSRNHDRRESGHSPSCNGEVIDWKVLQFRGVAFSSPHRRETLRRL